MVVKIALWNVKGMCNTLKKTEVKKLIKVNSFSFIGINETQLRKKFVKSVCGTFLISGIGFLIMWIVLKDVGLLWVGILWLLKLS